jgi:hypothetical protein
MKDNGLPIQYVIRLSLTGCIREEYTNAQYWKHFIDLIRLKNYKIPIHFKNELIGESSFMVYPNIDMIGLQHSFDNQLMELYFSSSDEIIIKNKELLLLDSNNYPEELREETNRINKELSMIINTSLNANENTILAPKSVFKIKYLEWEGLLCYENKNWLNMNELDRKLFMVKGKNGTGKSAIYDILLLAIWGENTKKNSLSSGVVNHNKNKGYTIVDIELNNKETYRIFRNYSKKNIGNKLLVSCSVIYRYINNDNKATLEIIKKDTACNNEIHRLFGDIDNFLSTSMITQSIDCDILKMDFKAILELIDKSFNIEYIYHLYNVFNKTINKYKGLHKYVESKKDVYVRLLKSNSDEEELEKLKEESDILNNKICILKEEYENNTKLINSFSVDTDTILKIDCDVLENKIDYKKTVSESTYNNNKSRFAELEYILKGKDILNLSKQYDELRLESFLSQHLRQLIVGRLHV